MDVLLLRLAGPLQSWGADSRFETRNTGREPTKSGVIGLIAAALGIKREDSETELSELNNLKFAVRVDKEGELLHDFHITKGEKTNYLTHRYYLSDAVFTVGLESDNEELLKKISNAIDNPVFSLFLGRRSCPPQFPVNMGIKSGELMAVLENEMLPENAECLRFVYENDSEGRVIQDVPVSYSQRHRKYGYRRYREKLLRKNEHDPMSEL